ncbi:hypothetical protein QN277_015598 [Acacia crassicarpa]|uniref:Glycine-rich protein n=1 Tax=Acacia crassicarpa TaxID=499986 RepID=A0AAE1MTJ7_9FABA|nr:hypothetical protein QN277_015598 [Acacia crassicarpa]
MGVLMKKMKSFASLMAITLLLLAIFCNNLACAEFKLGRKLSQQGYGSPGGYGRAPTYGGRYNPPGYGGYGTPGYGPPGHGGYRPPGYGTPGYGGYRASHSSSKP